MRPVFRRGHAAVANLQHVRVIPVAAAGVRREPALVESDVGHRFPVVLNIAGGAPEIRAHLRPPRPNIGGAVFAQAVDEGAAAPRQGPAHLLVGRLKVGVMVDSGSAAPIVFEIVDSPLGESLRILLLVTVTSLIAATGHRPGRGVDAQLQSTAVNVVRERLHVGKLGVGDDVALGVAPTLPGVVDVNENIAGRGHAAGHYCVRGLAHRDVVDLVAEMIPAVPAHRRSQGQSVGGHGFQGGQRNHGRRIDVPFRHPDRRGLFAVLSPVDDRDPQLVAVGVDAVLRAPVDAERGIGPLQTRLAQGEIDPAVDDHFAVEFGPFLNEDQESMQRDAAAPHVVDPPGPIQNRGLGGCEHQPEDSSNEYLFHVGSLPTTPSVRRNPSGTGLPTRGG